MLIQLIQISRSARIPPSNIPHPQSEFETLQLLDILFHSDSQSTFKTVVKSLLDTAFSSNTNRLMVSHLACSSILPEFRLVKRETWSSEEKRERDRGRVKRTRSWTSSSNSAEDAVQFAANPMTSSLTGATTFMKQSNESSEPYLGFDAGVKPNDIDKLTTADSSNLLLVFDAKSTVNNKNSVLNFDNIRR